jgi:hypothetical protein
VDRTKWRKSRNLLFQTVPKCQVSVMHRTATASLLAGDQHRARLQARSVAGILSSLALVAMVVSHASSRRVFLEGDWPAAQEPQPGVVQWRPMDPPMFDATYGAGYPGYMSSYGNLPADQAPAYAQMYAYNNPLAGTAVTYMPPGGAPEGISQEEGTAMGMYQPYPYGPLDRPMPAALAPAPVDPGGVWADYGPQTQTQVIINGDSAASGEEEGAESNSGSDLYKKQSVTVTVPQGPLPVNFPAVQLDPAGAPFGSTASTAKFFNEYKQARRQEQIKSAFPLPAVNLTYTNYPMAYVPFPGQGPPPIDMFTGEGPDGSAPYRISGQLVGTYPNTGVFVGGDQAGTAVSKKQRRMQQLLQLRRNARGSRRTPGGW